MSHVLVIDDDPGVRSFLRAALEWAGHEVSVAPDGHVGLRLFSQRPADLVILDIFMPHNDGLGVLLELLHEDPNAKIVVISGGGKNAEFEYLNDARALGAARALRKPIQVNDLIAVVQDVLQEAA